MFGRKPKAPKPPKIRSDISTDYWRLVDDLKLAGGFSGPDYHRQTYEHALPDGGMLVMVRYGDQNGESVTTCYVPPMPRPPGPALRSEPWESGIARESTK